MGEIKFPTELTKIIDLCRRKGIKSIEIEGLKMELNDEAPPSNYKRKESQGSDKPEKTLTEEDFLMWSVEQEVDDGQSN